MENEPISMHEPSHQSKLCQSAFQSVRSNKNISQEIRPSKILGEENFLKIIQKCDDYMKEEGMQISEYISKLVENYKKDHKIEPSQIPTFKFCLKILKLDNDYSVRPPMLSMNLPSLNRICTEMQQNIELDSQIKTKILPD